MSLRVCVRILGFPRIRGIILWVPRKKGYRILRVYIGLALFRKTTMYMYVYVYMIILR